MPQQRTARRRQPVHRRNRKKLPIGLAVAGVTVVAVVAGLAFVLLGGDGDNPTIGTSATATTWDTSVANGPRLDVDRTVHDEGSVEYEHEVSATFRVKNTGSETLSLGNPRVNTLEGC
jgi:hypothetical protein